MDLTVSNLYGPKNENGWGTPLNLKGEDGEVGKQGATGQQGATGSQGAAGSKGDTGLKGDKGETGARGDTGDKGDPGAAGSKILSGTANPGTSVGVNGDYYLNKTNGDFFGPKFSHTKTHVLFSPSSGTQRSGLQ